MKKGGARFQFQPFSRKQKKLLTWWTNKSPYRDYDIVIADGSIRSGKTIAMIDSFLMWSLSTFQNQTFIIAGKSMGALKRNVLEPMFQILNAKGIAYFYHRSDHYITIGSNIYYCFGANNEASQDVLQGLTAAGAYADEVALFPQSFIDQMVGRCSIEDSKVFLNCNPAGPYHWFKTEYIDKAKEKRTLRLHFTMDDNLSLSAKIKERFKRMFSGVFFKRYILGLWVLAEGLVYDMFDEKLHVIKTLPDTFDRIFAGGDYGINNPTAFLLIGQSGKDFYVIREYYYDSRKQGKQKTVSKYAEDFQSFIGNDHPEILFLDPSAAALILELKEKGIKYVRGADNTVIDGIQLVSNLLSNNGGRLFVHESCVNLIREFSSYSWDVKAQERGEDVVTKENDHALDALRYALYTMWLLLRKASIQKNRQRKGKGGWID
ncbi:PBSX family phage terminase large subunit [Brevibacillus halotolerans]|uniref:PBSX family phage terminase large subunit n=1 Tax=Brevibacillus halotolerans TaxID=1507437 RepID=UPI0015EE90F9|nr:PBSX family phage terminase large subunit [Brevibacillus halotolerans]MBA4535443.1 PBSX family phage terminase large subunit [Brevibacillus halotolerans]